MTDSLSVLVTGATGKQGGALARLLLQRGHRVRGVTRNPDSPAAAELKNLGAEIVSGNMEDHASMERAAEGVEAVFAVSTPFESGVEAETRQGISVAEAAKAAGVKHLVYTSVPKADSKTGIPHFESKAKVERHIKSLGAPYTILGPSFFMENLVGPYWMPGLHEGRFAIALSPTCKLQLICLEDVASFATLVLEHREQFLRRRIDFASDELTPLDIAHTLSRVIGRKISYHRTPIHEVRAWSKDLAMMYEWFDCVGTGIDIAALRRDYPEVGWHRFEQWAEAQSWDTLLHANAG